MAELHDEFGAVTPALEAFGRLDVLLANAGLYLPERGWEVDPTVVDRIGRTNVLGVMHCVNAVLPAFIAQGSGDIVVTSSVSGHHDDRVGAGLLRHETCGAGLRPRHPPPARRHRCAARRRGTGDRPEPVVGVDDGDRSLDAEVAAGRGMRSTDVADAVLFMLRAPRHVTIRDLVMVPTNQPI